VEPAAPGAVPLSQPQGGAGIPTITRDAAGNAAYEALIRRLLPMLSCGG
jgi:hypothetical protein